MIHLVKKYLDQSTLPIPEQNSHQIISFLAWVIKFWPRNMLYGVTSPCACIYMYIQLWELLKFAHLCALVSFSDIFLKCQILVEISRKSVLKYSMNDSVPFTQDSSKPCFSHWAYWDTQCGCVFVFVRLFVGSTVTKALPIHNLVSVTA